MSQMAFPDNANTLLRYKAQWELVFAEAPVTMNLNTTTEEAFQVWAPEFAEGARPLTYAGMDVVYDQPNFMLEGAP
jgi:hypothetical protein